MPTNDIDRAPVGSTTSFGMAPCCCCSLLFGMEAAEALFLLLRLPKSLGMKHVGWMHAPPLGPEALQGSGGRTSVVEAAQRRERSKSESMTWPSSLTRTFSGFRSRYTTPSMCRYSSARSTSAA